MSLGVRRRSSNGTHETTHEKGDKYEGDIFSGRALVECFALRVRNNPGRRRRRPRKTSDAEGRLSTSPRLISGCRESKPHLCLWYRATGGSLELSGQNPIPHRQLRPSASDFGKGSFATQERRCRTAIPWPYVVSSRGPKGGANGHPKWHERNLQLA